MRVSRWAVWYEDGSVVRGRRLRDLAGLAPTDGVQVVVRYHPGPYRTIMMGESTYRVRGAPGWVGRGTWMPEEDFNELVERAMVE
jgi:hypothetical protein